jgi:hypothetical protein
MKKEISQNLKRGKILSILIILLGTILLIYMITIEDEPGALPLFLIVVGTVLLIINRYQINKQSGLTNKVSE